MTPQQHTEFIALATPLIRFLNEYGNPHVTAIVTTTDAEMLEGIASTGQITGAPVVKTSENLAAKAEALAKALERQIVEFSGDRIFCRECHAKDFDRSPLPMLIIHKKGCPLAGRITGHSSTDGAGQDAGAPDDETAGQESCELEELRAWKAEASAVLGKIDFQAIGKLLNLELGRDVAPEILPRMKAMASELAALKGEIDAAWAAYPSGGAVRGLIRLHELVEGLVATRKRLRSHLLQVGDASNTLEKIQELITAARQAVITPGDKE